MTIEAGRTPRILIVTANFAAPGINSWLLDDLAASLVAHGASVDVLVDSPTAPRPRGARAHAPGLTVYSVGTEHRPTNAAAKLLSYARTAIRAHTDGWRWVESRQYDLCISTSIASFSFGFPSRTRARGVADRWLVIYWDFFPVHQIEIGRIRQRWLEPPLRAIEQHLLRRSDAIAVMSPASDRFLRNYFPALRQRTFGLPPWSRDGLHTPAADSDEHQFTLVFGGQLVAGRNVETLIRAMSMLPLTSRARLVIAGSGSGESALKALVVELGASNVEFAGQLEREQYFELLRDSDVGVNASSSNVSIPSYPSKIAGYCGMGLPILMAVEPFSDYGEQIEQAGAGIAVPADDPESLAHAITQLEGEFETGTLANRRRAARAFFESTLSSDSAARKILREMGLA